MTTIINPGQNDSGVWGLIVGVLVLIVAVILFFTYGLPAIRNASNPQENNELDVNVTLPAGQPSGDQNNVQEPLYKE